MTHERRVEITDTLFSDLVAEAEHGYDPDQLRPLPAIRARAHLRLVGMFVHEALDQLWYASPDAMPDGLAPDDERREDFLGCCPRCCAKCYALQGALTAGLLDIWVQYWPDTLPGTCWWDEDKREVRRDFLHRSWSQTDKRRCHDGDDVEVDQ